MLQQQPSTEGTVGDSYIAIHINILSDYLICIRFDYYKYILVTVIIIRDDRT